ncbi:hypothetical protein J8273_3862 [Carpediemonas membranifera]|uniref:Uncharacterized protein n=1 Tax=Carpediemonas membranifera TaxID=201153 RepID=A0A8J6B2Z7_9EUKA|nr:hypothetical protein J8273_3862 [Carpediemonas membranifera]|eukprot:KAG9394608.1 hypothetical protein J8273_3862 [Carpediemonas membranifera]
MSDSISLKDFVVSACDYIFADLRNSIGALVEATGGETSIIDSTPEFLKTFHYYQAMLLRLGGLIKFASDNLADYSHLEILTGQLGCIASAPDILARFLITGQSAFISRTPRLVVPRSIDLAAMGEYRHFPHIIQDPFISRRNRYVPRTPTERDMVLARRCVDRVVTAMILREPALFGLKNRGLVTLHRDGPMTKLSFAHAPFRPDFVLTLFPRLDNETAKVYTQEWFSSYGAFTAPTLPDIDTPAALVGHCSWDCSRFVEVVNPSLYTNDAGKNSIAGRIATVASACVAKGGGLVDLVTALGVEATTMELLAVKKVRLPVDFEVDLSGLTVKLEIWPKLRQSDVRPSLPREPVTMTVAYDKTTMTMGVTTAPAVGLSMRPLDELSGMVSDFIDKLSLMRLSALVRRFPGATIQKRTAEAGSTWVMISDSTVTRVDRVTGELIDSSEIKFNPDLGSICGLVSTTTLPGSTMTAPWGAFVTLPELRQVQPALWLMLAPKPKIVIYWRRVVVVGPELDVPGFNSPDTHTLIQLHSFLASHHNNGTHKTIAEQVLHTEFAARRDLPNRMYRNTKISASVVSVPESTQVEVTLTVGSNPATTVRFDSFDAVTLQAMVDSTLASRSITVYMDAIHRVVSGMQQMVTLASAQSGNEINVTAAYLQMDSPIKNIVVRPLKQEVAVEFSDVMARPLLDDLVYKLHATPDGKPMAIQDKISRTISALPLFNIITALVRPIETPSSMVGVPIRSVICPCDWAVEPCPPPIAIPQASVTSVSITVGGVGIVVTVAVTETGGRAFITDLAQLTCPKSGRQVSELYAVDYGANPAVTAHSLLSESNRLAVLLNQRDTHPLPYLPSLVEHIFGRDTDMTYRSSATVGFPLWRLSKPGAVPDVDTRMCQARLWCLVKNHMLSMNSMYSTVPSVVRHLEYYTEAQLGAQGAGIVLFSASTMLGEGTVKQRRTITIFTKPLFAPAAADGKVHDPPLCLSMQVFDFPSGQQPKIFGVGPESAVVRYPLAQKPGQPPASQHSVASKVLADMFRNAVYTNEPERLASIFALVAIPTNYVLYAVLSQFFYPTPSARAHDEDYDFSGLLTMRSVMRQDEINPQCDGGKEAWWAFVSVAKVPYDNLPSNYVSGFKLRMMVKCRLRLQGQPQSAPVDVMDEANGIYIPLDLHVVFAPDPAGQLRPSVTLRLLHSAQSRLRQGTPFVQMGRAVVVKSDKLELLRFADGTYSYLNEGALANDRVTRYYYQGHVCDAVNSRTDAAWAGIGPKISQAVHQQTTTEGQPYYGLPSNTLFMILFLRNSFNYIRQVLDEQAQGTMRSAQHTVDEGALVVVPSHRPKTISFTRKSG